MQRITRRWCVSWLAAATTMAMMAVPLQAQSKPATQQTPSTQQPGTQQQAKDTTNSPTKVDLDDLEKHPEKYEGKTVMVEGEVDRVLGPHLFTIDEKNWVDLDRELPVVVPEPFTAIVVSDSPVRVTGTVQKVPIATIEREHAILSKEAKLKAEIETAPALVATEVTTIAPTAVSLRVRANQPVGTSGTGSKPTATDAEQLAKAQDKNMVGQRVSLKNVPVSGPTAEGFWIRLASGERIFVMPARKSGVREGQTVDIEGVVLELPEGLRVQVNAGNEPIYIYADRATAR